MKKIYRKIIILIIGIIIILLNNNYSYAVINITTPAKVNPGDTVTINISTTEKVKIYRITLLNRNEFVETSAKKLQGTGFDSKVAVNGVDNNGMEGNLASFSLKLKEGYDKSYKAKFEVKLGNVIKNVETVIKTKSEPKKEEPKKSTEVISKKDVNKSNKIAVEKAADSTKANKSSNNYLKNISTNLGNLSPSFNRSQTSYILSFPYDFDYKTLDKIVINATKEDDKEKISGTGTKEVKVGTNVYNILVTAENGETRTYAIKLIKPEISEDKNIRLSKIKLTYIDENGNTVELPLNKDFDPEGFQYSLNVGSKVKSIKVDTTLPDDSQGIKVSVSGNEDLQDGENIITITLMNENDDTENPKKTIYTIKVNKVAEVPAEVAITQKVEEPKKEFNIKLIIGVILGIIFLLIFILIILLIINKKQSKNKAEYGDDEFIDEDENFMNYNVDNQFDNYENNNAINLNDDYMNEDFVKKEDIEKAQILEGYDSKILNSDFEETPEIDEEITSLLNDNNKDNKHRKGKRFL